MESLTISKDDKGYNLAFTILESDEETEKVLTGYTITLKMWKPGIPGTLLIEGACVIDDADAGTCHYVIQEDDFDTKGRFQSELELTKTGIIESTEPFIIYVVESG